MQVSLYNVKANGKRDYLSIGEDMLPTVFMVRSHCNVKRSICKPHCTKALLRHGVGVRGPENAAKRHISTCIVNCSTRK